MAYRADWAGSGATMVRRTGRWWRHTLAVLALAAYVGAGATGVRALWARWQAARFAARGVGYGTVALVVGTSADARAVNVALEQYDDDAALARSLDLLAAGGFRSVRQRFPWAEIEPARGEFRWQRWDAIVEACRARDLTVIAVLDGSPDWARAPEDAPNPLSPPRNPADLATFARAFASRYGDAIDYYQIWDEPNIYPHWGERDVSPEGYLGLLRAARTQIRDVDPGAVLVCAGLAPTTEEGGRNLSELLYLRRLYAGGGGDLFDVVADKPYGFWSGPEDRSVDPQVLNFSRIILLHEEMVRQGDAAKPIWAVAWGWNALPADWEGRPSPWGADVAWRQHGRDERAIRRVREEWPWLGLMCYAAWQPAAPSDDPIWGLALLDPNGEPGPLYYRFRRLLQEAQTLYPGYHAVRAETGPTEIAFWGNRLDLASPGRWRLADLDGRPLNRALTVDERPAAVVTGLPLGEHRLTLERDPAGGALEVAVSREWLPWQPWQQSVALAVAALLATGALWFLLRPYPWRRWAAAALAVCRRVPPWAAFGAQVAIVGALAVVPNLVPSVLALAALGLGILARPDAGLMLAVFLIPLAPLQKAFGPARFSYLEIVTLLTLGAWLLQEGPATVGRWLSRRPSLRAAHALRGANGLDVGFALLLAASGVSLLASTNLHVSLRELRVVVLEALFLYWLVSRGRLGRQGVLRLVDVLMLSTVLVSLQGLHQFLWTERVIIAEGLRRVRGIYGSPNNLALVLGRALPILLATLLCGPRGWRRWVYGLAVLPTAVCLFLTFSKGAILLGVPASLLVLGLLGGRRSRVAVLGLAVLGALGLVPLLRTVRFAAVLSLQGTNLLRLKLWEAALDMARDHPWLGVGLDNFLYQYPRYIRPEAMSEPNLSHPHNVVLDFWLRLGVPGLVTLGWLQWSYFRQALRLWRRRSDPALWALTVGLVGAAADMLAHGLVDASFFVPELGAMYAVMAALVWRMGELEP